MNRYEYLSNGVFDGILEDMVSTMTAAEILSIPGVYELISEELNNAIMTIWEEEDRQVGGRDDAAETE